LAERKPEASPIPVGKADQGGDDDYQVDEIDH
jgi:hypothetical protein